MVQYLALRAHMPQANRWMWVSAATWALQLGGSVLWVVGLSMLSAGRATPPAPVVALALGIVPVVGVLAGLPQSWFLKALSPRAKWWSWLNAVMWSVSLLIAVWIGLPVLSSEGDMLPYVVSPWVVGSILGLVNGVLTATALVWVGQTSSHFNNH